MSAAREPLQRRIIIPGKPKHDTIVAYGDAQMQRTEEVRR